MFIEVLRMCSSYTATASRQLAGCPDATIAIAAETSSHRRHGINN